MDGFPKFVALEGYGGLFKGLVPLWGRQVPYTMMKFGKLSALAPFICFTLLCLNSMLRERCPSAL